MNVNSYADAVELNLVGTYSPLAKAGGGYVWDDVLEYRVWCHPERGSADLEDGSDYYALFISPCAHTATLYPRGLHECLIVPPLSDQLGRLYKFHSRELAVHLGMTLHLVGPSFFLGRSFGTFCHDFQVGGINKYPLPGTSA